MIVSEKNRFVYIAIAKTGSHSVKKTLRENFKVTNLRPHHRVHAQIGRHKKYFVFTTVRNPAYRLLSMYEWDLRKQNVVGDMTFSDWLEWIIEYKPTKMRSPPVGMGMHFFSIPKNRWTLWNCRGQSQVKIMRAANFNNPVTPIRIERVAQEFRRLPFVRNRSIHFPHLNKGTYLFARSPEFFQGLDSKTIDLIERHSGLDFDELGYERPWG